MNPTTLDLFADMPFNLAGETLPPEPEPKPEKREETADLFGEPILDPIPPLPRGFRVETFGGFEGRLYRRAIDPDGCRWYVIDGRWTLNVPWFRDVDGVEMAVVDTVRGGVPYPITRAGTIKIGTRKISRRNWNH